MNNITAEEERNDRQGIQVIARAAALLRALEAHPDGLSLGELARHIGLARSTVQRIADALHKEGLVMAASAQSGVRLGPALLSLAGATRFHIGETARQTLKLLARDCDETVDLSIADHDKVIFIDQIAGKQRLSAISAVGISFPLHSSANGKAILATMSDAEINKLRKRIVLEAVTPNTMTTWNQLDREVDLIRKNGVAFDREENSLGISAMSIAIRSPDGEIAAISIPAPSSRFEEKRENLEKLLRQYCTALQRKLVPS